MENPTRQIHRIAEWKKCLLPRTLPKVRGWEWAAYTSESLLPGGDYYDFVLLQPKEWLVFLADACGHGGASAVLGAVARVVTHSCPLTSGQERQPFCPVHAMAQTPSVIMARLNESLVENSLDEQFMTAFLASWKPELARMDFVLAGHELPLCWRQSAARVERCSSPSGLPLGIAASQPYLPARVTLDRGDAFVLLTDGLTEACSPRDGMFGVERVEQIMAAEAANGANAIKNAVLRALEEFLEGNPLEDDVTLLVLKRWD